METATITVTDGADAPLAGATVAYNSQSPKVTDSSGTVTFDQEETTQVVVSKDGCDTVTISSDAPLEELVLQLTTVVMTNEQGPLTEE